MGSGGGGIQPREYTFFFASSVFLWLLLYHLCKEGGRLFFLIGTIFRADLHKCIFFLKNKFSEKNIRAPEERNMQVGKELIHSAFKLFGALFFISISLNE